MHAFSSSLELIIIFVLFLSHGCGCQQGPAWPPRYSSLEILTLHIWFCSRNSVQTYPLLEVFFPYT
jgi:hypothetical protein